MAAAPTGVSMSCSTNSVNKNVCTYSCANGGDFGNFSGKTPSSATMKCKCPRTGSDNVRVCGWFSRRLSDQKPPLVQQSAIDAFTCLDPPTTTTTTTLSTTTAEAAATTQGGAATTTQAAGETTTVASSDGTTTAAAGVTTATTTAGVAQTTSTTTTASTTTTSEVTAPPTDPSQTTFDARSDLIDSSLNYCTAAENGLTGGGRIVGGQEVVKGSWPFIARLFFQTQAQVDAGLGQGILCGGSLIANQWLITAAHCCESQAKVQAFFGEWRSNENEPETFIVTSTTLFNHPDYLDSSDGNSQNTDYCLVKFDEDVMSHSSNMGVTQMACLPTAAIGVDGNAGQACWVAGWGRENANDAQGSTSLNSAGVNIFSHTYCTTKTSYFPLPDDICAGIPDENNDGSSDGGKDSCQGDSGGPLICPINGKATLVGVVSRGSGCADAGTSGLYSATYWADSWIKTTVNNN